MLEAMLKICNSANGQYSIHISTIEKNPSKTSLKTIGKGKLSTDLKVEKRFNLNWNFYAGDVIDKVKLDVAM